MRLWPDMVVLSSALRDAGTIVEAFGSSGLKGLTLGALGKVASFSRHFLRENFKLMDIQTRASFYRWAGAGGVGLWPSLALTSSRPRRTACRLNERPHPPNCLQLKEVNMNFCEFDHYPSFNCFHQKELRDFEEDISVEQV